MFGCHDLTGQQWNLGGCEAEIRQKILVDFFYFGTPGRVAVVCLSLMEKNPLDYTVLLRYARAFNQPFVRRIVVGGHESFVPVGFVGYAHRIEVFVEMGDICAPDGYGNNADTYFVRKICHHCASEIVHGCETCALTHKGRHGLAPHTFGAGGRCEVYSRQQAEAPGNILPIDWLNGGIPFHIRLSKTEIDVKIGIGLSRGLKQPGGSGNRYYNTG